MERYCCTRRGRARRITAVLDVESTLLHPHVSPY
jgi:hypothetical protein